MSDSEHGGAAAITISPPRPPRLGGSGFATRLHAIATLRYGRELPPEDMLTSLPVEVRELMDGMALDLLPETLRSKPLKGRRVSWDNARQLQLIVVMNTLISDGLPLMKAAEMYR